MLLHLTQEYSHTLTPSSAPPPNTHKQEEKNDKNWVGWVYYSITSLCQVAFRA